MAGRLKTDANEALKKLTAYLRRDMGATNWLGSISRYIGELRQTQTKLKADIAFLETHSIGIRERVATLELDLAQSQDRVEIEQAKARQARSEATAAQNAVTEITANLESQLEPGLDPEVIASNLRDMNHYSATVNILRRKLKRPPDMLACATVSASSVIEHTEKSLEKSLSSMKIRVCRLSDVVTDYRSDQFETLGRLVVITSMIGLPLVFYGDDRRNFGDVDDNRLFHLVRWTRRWFHWTDAEASKQMERDALIAKKRGNIYVNSSYPTGATGDKG